MRILVLGVSGMLGNAVFRFLSELNIHQVYGTARNNNIKEYIHSDYCENVITGLDVLDHDSLLDVIGEIKPDVIVNCIGLVKQLVEANNPLVVLPINSLLPHRLSKICDLIDARLIHFSTDCVFSGENGLYTESDISDARDLYGKSKYIGEVNNNSNTITLRTSIIGHELSSNHSLINWFLSQTNSIKGFDKFIFSGLPTVELASIISNYILPNDNLFGLYHVSSDPISKYDLLVLVAEIYGKNIEIIRDKEIILNRSLDSERFQKETGYIPPKWDDLIRFMHSYHQNRK